MHICFTRVPCGVFYSCPCVCLCRACWFSTVSLSCMFVFYSVSCVCPVLYSVLCPTCLYSTLYHVFVLYCILRCVLHVCILLCIMCLSCIVFYAVSYMFVFYSVSCVCPVLYSTLCPTCLYSTYIISVAQSRHKKGEKRHKKHRTKGSSSETGSSDDSDDNTPSDTHLLNK